MSAASTISPDSSSSRSTFRSESESSESLSENDNVSKVASEQLIRDEAQGASSVSRSKKNFKSERDTKKPCSKKANGCFGNLFLKKHNKVPQALFRSDSE